MRSPRVSAVRVGRAANRLIQMCSGFRFSRGTLRFVHPNRRECTRGMTIGESTGVLCISCGSLCDRSGAMVVGCRERSASARIMGP